MKWNDLTMKERSDLMSLFLKAGIGSLSDIRRIYNEGYKFSGEENTNKEKNSKNGKGGYTEDSLEKREWLHKKYDPAGGLGVTQFLYGSNKSEGEEDQYWREYLGLDSVVPKMNPKAKTSWDDEIERRKRENGELPSEFYGTTDKMDQHLQVIADTLNTGRILRNYDYYKQKYPNLASKDHIKHFYNTGKRVMENPDKWTQVREEGQFILKDQLENNELAPLGMLADFGMMWRPKENALYIHDTYDFPTLNRVIGGIPERPKEMKIRGRISYSPERESYLLRNNMANFNKAARGLGYSDLWDKWMDELYKDVK